MWSTLAGIQNHISGATTPTPYYLAFFFLSKRKLLFYSKLQMELNLSATW